MLYKVKEGVIDRSYGIHVAEMLKFPEEVLREAKALASELENFQEVTYKAQWFCAISNSLKSLIHN